MVAKALDVDALRLFRLAGYIPPEPSAHSIRADYLAEMQMKHANEVVRIQPDIKVLQYMWKDLPTSTQQRVKALIEHKLSLDYDPTMVDPEWRD